MITQYFSLPGAGPSAAAPSVPLMLAEERGPHGPAPQLRQPSGALPAAPRYNIAPSQPVSAVRAVAATGEREMIAARWGLIPAWSRDGTGGPINARSETLTSRPTFRDAFRGRRCLIPADGFYEWQVVSPKRKQPWYIHRADDGLFAFGGLWERWRDPAKEAWVETCAIITTAPNEQMAAVHDRMPLILDPEDFEPWLSPAEPAPLGLLRPYPEGALQMHRISPLVNRPENDVPECREPIREEGLLFSE